MQKLIVQRGARYEIRAIEIAPGLYRLSTCVAGSQSGATVHRAVAASPSKPG